MSDAIFEVRKLAHSDYLINFRGAFNKFQKRGYFLAAAKFFETLQKINIYSTKRKRHSLSASPWLQYDCCSWHIVLRNNVSKVGRIAYS